MTNERDEAFLATVALHPHGQIWFYGLLSMRYMEDETNDRGLNHETSDPF